MTDNEPRMWRDTWRYPETRLPAEGDHVVVLTKVGVLRNATFTGGEFKSIGKNATGIDNVQGWVPFPALCLVVGDNIDIPIEATYPYIQRDLTRLKKKYAELKEGYKKLWDLYEKYRNEVDNYDANFLDYQQLNINLTKENEKLKAENKELKKYKTVRNNILSMLGRTKGQIEKIENFLVNYLEEENAASAAADTKEEINTRIEIPFIP